MSKHPDVSVIMPVYNCEKTICSAINCLINQTLKNLEIIIIDDGSTDNSADIIDEYGQKDNRIIVIHKKNEGYGKTCNYGVSIAKGEYIAIFEPDDSADTHMYEDLLNLAIKTEADIVKSSFNIQTKINGKYRTKKIDLGKYFSPNNQIYTINDCPAILQEHPSIWSCLYKLKFIKDNGIKFLEIPGAGWTDNLFQVQTMCLANKITYCPEAYYFWAVEKEDPSDNLTDYSVPINRSLEINKWIAENKFTQPCILENIYKRELHYLKIILGMKNLSNPKDCYTGINNLLKTMDENIIKNSFEISKREKFFYKNLKNNPGKIRLCLKLRRIRRNILSFKYSKDTKFLKLFGKYLFYKSEVSNI